MSRLDEKVAIVTGASPNIGGTLAAGLAAEGARIVCTDIDPGVAAEAAEKITGAGGEAVAVAGDVTDPDHADEVVTLAERTWGGVDVLVNNAVQFNHKGLLTMSVAEFRRQVDIILTGTFLFTRAAASSMIRTGRRGSVVVVLSTAATQGQPGNIGYSTAKSGLVNFVRSSAMELAGHGIRVNGFTPTATVRVQPAPARRAEPEYTMDFAGQFPMDRLPTAADYVPAVVCLASDDSAMVTGSNITVDGGATAKYWPWYPGTARDTTLT